ncbi:MAG: hypothetical protein QNJ44_22595 [Rhodobacter sp.]|nr:hypothetical protein [Rhodobacter sp.]
MHVNTPVYPVDPDLEIAAACQIIEALCVAVEALFTDLQPYCPDSAEKTALPILILLILSEQSKIAQALERLSGEDGDD